MMPSFRAIAQRRQSNYLCNYWVISKELFNCHPLGTGDNERECLP
jgi:hypothetical protein